MKLLITVVQDKDVQALLEELTEHGFSVTKLASTGGFLKVGNTTLLIGVDDSQVDAVMELITAVCSASSGEETEVKGGKPQRSKRVKLQGATVFILDVERFERV